ncbi:hypothetical protein ACFL67_01790 [candidate division KSB1 bacterium]
MQSLLYANLDTSQVIIAGLNHTAAVDWLTNYSTQNAIELPMLMSNDDLLDEYHLGYLKYGSLMPGYFVIDPSGKIVQRYDGNLGIMNDINLYLEQLITLYFP